MPQIKIKEVDKTNAIAGEYQNFAVVVPGYVSSDYNKDVFDTNGIYECSSQLDFENNVGLIVDSTPIDAIAPILKNLGEEGEETEVTKRHLTPVEFFVTYVGHVYIAQSWPTGVTPEVGYLKDADAKYVPVEAEEFDADVEYCVIEEGNEGRDARVGSEQIGNQIAYELLGLGYPILYKKISNAEDSSDEENIAKDAFWEPLKDKATYDFRFLISGLLSGNSAVNACMIKIADYDNSKDNVLENGRGDVTALLDVDEAIYNTSENRASRTKLYNAIKGYVNGTTSKYAAWFAPTVCLLGVEEKYGNNKFPASFYYLACFKYALDHGFAEWYAAAGYTRGVCKYTIESTDVNFGEYLINALEPRNNESGLEVAVNVVAKIRNNYYLWGNRTAEKLRADDLIASHFLNIRQLCSTLKKQIYVACRRFTFDPNSDVLWINFCNAIKPTLEKMKADQGIKDYAIVKVAGSRKAELKARIRIIPIEAVEDFDIEISLEDNFGETSATAVER